MPGGVRALVAFISTLTENRCSQTVQFPPVILLFSQSRPVTCVRLHSRSLVEASHCEATIV